MFSKWLSTFFYRLEDIDRIETALSSRWSQDCLNVSIDENHFSILASKVDTYYVMVNSSFNVLVQDRSAIQKEPNKTYKTLPDYESATTSQATAIASSSQPRTILVEIDGQYYCPNDLVRAHQEFYLPTMVSAVIRGNERCKRLLCSTHRRMYFERDELRFLGSGWDANIWESRCFEEFGKELISSLYQAGDGGLLTTNKFWAFENFNYLVFMNNVTGINNSTLRCELQVESFYLSDLAFAAEICLAFVMTVICLVSS